MAKKNGKKEKKIMKKIEATNIVVSQVQHSEREKSILPLSEY